MRLICKSPYRTQTVAYKLGEVIEVKDEEGALLLRDSPGSFETPQATVARAAPDVADSETETETGIKAPDRRSRGGRKRGRS